MDGSKTVYLANGDAVILLDGQYFISYGGDTQPVGIEREEGERLVFETCNQLTTNITRLAEDWNKIVEERNTLQEDNEQLEDDITALKNSIVHKHLPRIEELERFINDYLDLNRKQKKLCEHAENLLW